MKKFRFTSFLFLMIMSLGTLCSCRGLDGFLGQQGSQDTQGIEGPQGPQGPQGEQGEKGEDGHTPVIIIGENGNWFIDGVDTGVKAQGDKGDTGATGNGIAKIEKTSSPDAYTDIYTITFTDGTTTEFTVTNGKPVNEEEYIVTFDTNGGSKIESQKVKFGYKANKPQDPTKDGYLFVDWVDEYNDHWVFNGYSITEDITLYAVWAPKTYKLAYYENGELLEEKNVAYGEEIVLGSSSSDYFYEFKDEFAEYEDGDKLIWNFTDNISINVVKRNSLEKYEYELNEEQKTIAITGIKLSRMTKAELMSEYIINGKKYTLTEIRMFAFGNTENLKEVYIPASVININVWAFLNSNVEHIVVDPDNLVYDSRDNCNAVILTEQNALVISCKNTTIPNSVTTLARHSFMQSKIENLTIPNGVTTIEADAFCNCVTLTSIVIPASVTTVEGGAFSACDKLYSISVDSNNPIYDSRDNCNAIIETATNKLVVACNGSIIPDDVVEIGDNAFDHINAMTELVLSDNITKIGDNAFWNSAKIQSIYIGKNLTSIGRTAFSSPNLKTIVVDPENPVYDSRNDCNAIIETATNRLIVACETTAIPNGITTIGIYSFMGTYNIKSIDIPYGVTTIEHAAFMSCMQMKNIVIPNSITFVENQAFDQCDSLETVYYGGTEEEWNAIVMNNNNDALTNANRYYYSETAPSEAGNYWHYVDGEATIWNLNN